ncbi:MAG: peptidoglycan-binding protein, partial [Proteobacteria bacterium]|nr:peptidoglycan-binding protein [Pseudomonadota bacterium]
IILGQPELLDILAKTEMRQLAQRITARFHLQPLTKEEVKAYVSHRLAVAGQNIQLFPENSIKLLFKLSNGVPRLINILCDRALLGAYVEAQHSVHPSILKKAATEVFGELKNVERQQKNKQILYPVVAVASVAIIAIVLFLYFTFSPAPETQNLSEKDNEAAGTTSINTAADIATIDTTPELIEESVSESPLPESIASDETIQSNDISSDISSNEPVDLAEAAATDNQLNHDYEEASGIPADTPVGTPADTPVNPPLLAKQKFDEIGEILSTKRNGQIAAYQELFKAWNQTYNKKSLVTVCKQAKTFALSCLHKQGNLNSLKAHNRPAVLKLVNNNGKTQHVTITSIQDKLATVYSNNKKYTIQLSDLDQYWYGQFIILWQRPEHYSSAITPGDNGSIVNWLNTHFTENKHSIDNAANTYDDKLIKKVKQFQADHGLSADGIVGPVTIIHLNTESDLNVPTLARQS